MSFIFMNALPWFEEGPVLKEEEPELKPVPIPVGTVQMSAGVNILTGTEMMVQDLNRIVWNHTLLKWNVLYGHLVQ